MDLFLHFYHLWAIINNFSCLYIPCCSKASILEFLPIKTHVCYNLKFITVSLFIHKIILRFGILNYL